jgi:electron transfer flavoprotein alpha subunit
MIPYNRATAEKRLLVVLQQHGAGIHPISLELSAVARRLARAGKMQTAGILITGELGEKSRLDILQSGLGEVYVYEDTQYHPFNAEFHCAALVDCAAQLKPEIVLVGATPEGRILAPMAAIPLNTGVTADCTELDIDETGLLIQTRPAFGGGIMARIITAEARPQIATVRYGILRGNASKGADLTRILKTAVPLPESKIQSILIEETETESEENPVAIMALGAGIRAKEDLDFFRKTAAACQMELMCSRSLVERGWFSRNRQIGLSGRNVSPKLLVTLGISGSVQFMAGIGGAQKIIAVNINPDAPILRIAHLPLVGDLYEIMAELSQKNRIN